MRRSILFRIVSFACLIGVGYFGFVAYMYTLTSLPGILFCASSIFCLFNSILTWRRSHHYKELEETKLK